MAAQTSERGQDLEQIQQQHLEQESEQVEALGQRKAQRKTEQEQLKYPYQSLDHTLVLLEAKDDTSRFVGLALLKTILDNKVDFLKEPEVIRRCWAAIPARFLDRLLRAPRNKDRDKEESLNMVKLAVAVLHTFTVVFSKDLSDDGKSLGRIEGLLDILAWSRPDTRTQILQILLTLASTPTGSTAILCAERWAHLVDLVQQNHLALDVIKYTFVNTSSETFQRPNFERVVNETFSALITSAQDTSLQLPVFHALNDIFSLIPLSVFPPAPSWLGSLAALIRQSCVSRGEYSLIRDKTPNLILTASLLHLFPNQFLNFLFNELPTPPVSQESKPVSYMFIKLLLIDLQEVIPMLPQGSIPDTFPALDGLIASYDIISAFIGFLIHLDEEDPPLDHDNDTPHLSTSPFTPSLLLQLRADISETMSLTIENIRDRLEDSTYDAADILLIAPSVSETTSSTPMQKGSLTLSQIRTLALWLREDDNEALRKEAASISNILLVLYGAERSEHLLDIRSAVLIALEGIISVPEGVEAFLAADGWTILSRDLRAILTSPSSKNDKCAEFTRGIDIIRVLLNVVESECVGPAKEEWMDIIEQLASTPFSPPPPFRSSSCAAQNPSSHPLRTDLLIATAQLAVELLVRAPRNVRRRYVPAARKVLDMAREVRDGVEVSEDARDGAEEVVSALGGLVL